MSGAWLREAAVLCAVVLGLFAATAMVSLRRDQWHARFRQRRWTYALLIAAAVVLVKVTEDVLAHESGALDRVLLLDLHHEVPVSTLAFFEQATNTGSIKFLAPLAGILVMLLWLVRRRFEAAQLAGTLAASSLVVYVAKTAVGRVRPALWDTQWFGGASFPSGHTLSTAAFATAAFLCIARNWPSLRVPAAIVATGWVVVVGFSRLVLGVHWPTDVIAAACAGILVAAGVNAALAVAWRGGSQGAAAAFPSDDGTDDGGTA